jgi:hypothetical protein
MFKRYSWAQATGERPLEQNLVTFSAMVQTIYEMLINGDGVQLVHSEVQRICKPQYLLVVLRDMQIGKLLMQISTTEDNLRVISIRVVG